MATTVRDQIHSDTSWHPFSHPSKATSVSHSHFHWLETGNCLLPRNILCRKVGCQPSPVGPGPYGEQLVMFQLVVDLPVSVTVCYSY
jgi:hypothetical protein